MVRLGLAKPDFYQAYFSEPLRLFCLMFDHAYIRLIFALRQYGHFCISSFFGGPHPGTPQQRILQTLSAYGDSIAFGRDSGAVPSEFLPKPIEFYHSTVLTPSERTASHLLTERGFYRRYSVGSVKPLKRVLLDPYSSSREASPHGDRLWQIYLAQVRAEDADCRQTTRDRIHRPQAHLKESTHSLQSCISHAINWVAPL